MSQILFIFVVIILLQGIKLPFLYNFKFISYLDEIFIVIVFVLAICKIIKLRKINFDSLKYIGLLFLFCIIGVFSCIFNSQYSFKNLFYSAFLASKYWILVISLYVLNINNKNKETIIKAILFVEKIAIVVGLFNILFPNLYLNLFKLEELPYRFGFLSVSSCFNHPGTFGWFMLICSFIHILKYKESKKNCTREKIACFFDVVLAFFSFRTKVYLSVIICYFFYMFFFAKGNRQEKIKKLSYFFVASVIIFSFFGKVIFNTYNLYYKGEYGVTARSALQANSYKIALKYFPFGVGFGKYATWYASKNYSEYYFEYGMDKIYGLYPENPKYGTDVFWPAIIGETGFVGLIIFFCLIFCCFKKLLKNSKKNYFYPTLALLALIQTIVESFGSASFNSSPQNIISALLVGIALSDAYMKAGSSNE